MTKRFVYEGKEVKFTGRTAKRNAKRTTSRHMSEENVDTLLEIETVNEPIKTKSWVKKEDLYEIQDISDNITIGDDE